MSHLHKRERLNGGDCVEVDCSHQCNVMVMTDSNYRAYKRGARFQYHGGFYKRLPARIVVPDNDDWNIVIDLGGGSARIRHSIRILAA